MHLGSLPEKQGLYDPTNEHDACGVGFVAHIKGEKSHNIIEQGLTILKRIVHRGAVGADPVSGTRRTARPVGSHQGPATPSVHLYSDSW